MKNLFITIFLIYGFSGYSQFFPVDTARLNNAYSVYISEPDNSENQMDFLEAFPSTFKDFSYTYTFFNDKDYDLTMYNKEVDHLKGLLELDLIEDSIYCEKLIWICLGGQWDADAPGNLQSVIKATLGKRKEGMFKQLKRMSEGQQVSFWFFYYHDRFKSKESEFNELKSEMRSRYPNVVHSMEIAYPAAAGMVWY